MNTPSSSRHPNSSQLITVSGKVEPANRPGLIGLESRAPYKHWWERSDVYYDSCMWEGGLSLLPRSLLHHTIDDKTGAVFNSRIDDPLHIGTTREDPGRKGWQHVINSELTHRMIAALDGFGHATTEQLTALAGWSPATASRHTLTAWKMGLVRRGRSRVRVDGSLQYVWTLHDSARLRKFSTALGEDAQRVFGGRDRPRIGSPHTRHDVLVTEAVLRLLETSDRWIAVDAEHQANPHTITGIDDAPKGFRGDAVLWRDDGLRVVLELAASRNSDHVRKQMNRWAGWLAGHPPSETGMIVVFLNASGRRHAGFANELRRLHTQIIDSPRLRHTSGAIANRREVSRARAQIHLASWEDWFPAPKTISIAGAHATTATLAPGPKDGHAWTLYDPTDPATLPYCPSSAARTPPDILLTPAWVSRR